MRTIEKYIQEQQIRFIDHSNCKSILDIPNNALASFAIDDALAVAVGEKKSPPTVRMWVHKPTLVLGIPDTRLPYIEDGVHLLRTLDHQVVIRNSGGLAVLLDKGVLNMSLIIPDDGTMSIHDGFDMMYQFIQQIFQRYTSEIKAYEIVGSYCPGKYDLSMNDIKFAGISQRRVRKGTAVQIYIDVEGDSVRRAGLVRDFYKVTTKGVPTKTIYPDVNPNVMGTISELMQQPFTVPDVIAMIRILLQQTFDLSQEGITAFEKGLFQKRLLQMIKRNEKIN